MLAPRNGGTRLCRQTGANFAGVRLRSRAKCWRLVTEAQGFAGNGAPTRPVSGRIPGQNVGASQRRHKALPAMGRQLGRRPGRTPGQNVGASQRRHKALPAMGRQLGRCPAALQGKMLAPRNGGTRLCRHWGANLADGQRRLRAKCWRLATEAQGFAGNGAPTRPVTGCAPGQNVGAS